MPRLLLIDDDPAGLELRRMILERTGHKVSCATEVTQAVDLFSKERPEIVVLDVRLPEPEDGLALIRDFRQRDPAAKIVVLCGHPPDIEGKPEAGLVNQILGKPVRTEKLIAAVSGSLSDSAQAPRTNLE